MSDDGEWIDGAMLDDWRDRDEAKNARIEALLAERDALSKAISHEGRRTDAAEAGLKKTTETLRYIAKQWPDTSAAKSALAAIRALGK